jgi:hypothetical protein
VYIVIVTSGAVTAYPSGVPPYIENEQTAQWTKEKVKKDKQLSTKHTHKAKNR